MGRVPISLIASACPNCTHEDRKCEVLKSTCNVIESMMSDVDKRVLEYLCSCEQHQDYTARISRGIHIPYMTVNRSLNRLIELHLISRDDEISNQYRYYHLTSFGIELGINLQRV